MSRPAATPDTLDCAAQLADIERALKAQDDAWKGQMSGVRAFFDPQLKGTVRGNVLEAASRPPLPAAPMEVDKATRFARQVKRRRNVI